MKNQHLTHNSIKSYALRFQAFKDTDNKEFGGLPKLTESTDLSWMDTSKKHLCKIPGAEFYPLAYILQDNATAPITTVNLLPGMFYLVTHYSLIEEYVERKSHLDTCC